MARADYAKENPQNVAKFLAVYLRAWKWLNAHQPEAIAMMKKFYEQGGVTISEASMKKEFTTRPTYDLAGQLKIMEAGRSNSPPCCLPELNCPMVRIGAIGEHHQRGRICSRRVIRYRFPTTAFQS